MSSKLELLRQKFANRAVAVPSKNEPGDVSKKGKGSDVRAIVLRQGDRWGKKVLYCFLHSVGDTKLGEKDRVEEDVLHLAPRPDQDSSVSTNDIVVKPFTMIDVTDNSKTPDAFQLGDAVWLVNLSAKEGNNRTFYDASFARRDYTTTGYSALQTSAHSLFYVPRFNPESYDNGVLLPVAPFPTDESQIPNPGVFAQLTFLDENSLVQERDNTIFARFSLSVTQWKTDIASDAVSVNLPNIRCWDSTLGAFGIQSPSHWSAIAPLLLKNVPFYLKGYAHKDSTTALLDRTTTSETDYALSIRVTGIVVDPEVMLSKVALRVPETYARSLLPPRGSQSDTKHYWNESKTLFFNATEALANGQDLPTADQWFVLTNIPSIIDEKARLDGLDDAGRQAWLEGERSCAQDAVFSVFLRTTKKRSASDAGLAGISNGP